MSALAMEGFHRLRVDRRYKLDGTARLLLYHLCWRHNEKTDVAWPSTREMAKDLDMNRSVVIEAIRRLEDIGLIRSERGGGRGKSTRYRLCFLGAHRLDPTSKQPIDWHYKGSGGPDRLVKGPVGRTLSPPKRSGGAYETVRPTGPETVRPTGPEKNKKMKSPPASAQERAGGPKSADQVFRERFAQGNLALLSVADGLAGTTADDKAHRPAGRKTGAG